MKAQFAYLSDGSGALTVVREGSEWSVWLSSQCHPERAEDAMDGLCLGVAASYAEAAAEAEATLDRLRVLIGPLGYFAGKIGAK